jgi:carboxymethylenebutenolidase
MNHMQQYLAEEFAEDYHEGRISRRQALKVIASLTGSMVLASSFLASCAPPTQSSATAPASATSSPGDQLNAPTNAAATSAPTAAASATVAPTAGADATSGPTTAPTEAATTNAATQAPYGTVVPDDPAITAGPAQFPGNDGVTLMGYMARPTSAGPFAVVLVCHENRGLTTHIQDVTRRFGKAGYAALAVDLLSRQGGSASVGEGNAPGALGAIAPDQFVQDFRSGWLYMKAQAFTQAERVGMVGFCFGGGVTWLVAEGMPELKAAVPFYGPPPPADQVPDIQAAVLAIYGGLDSRITSSEPAMEAAMQQANKVFDKMIYPDADHAFFNDTGTRFNAAAAQDAWGKTLAWFEKYL